FERQGRQPEAHQAEPAARDVEPKDDVMNRAQGSSPVGSAVLERGVWRLHTRPGGRRRPPDPVATSFVGETRPEANGRGMPAWPRPPPGRWRAGRPAAAPGARATWRGRPKWPRGSPTPQGNTPARCS